MRAAGRAVPGAAVLALLGLLVLPAGQASAASYHVVMKGYAFSPAALTITAGTTVTWTNEDTAPHDVKTTSGPVAIHSPMLSKGGSWSFTFGTAGSYGYVCTVHPGMTAQLVVKAAAPAASAAPTAHEHGGSSSGSSGSAGSAGAGQRHATVPGRTAAARTPAHSPSPSHAMSMPTAAAAPAAPATTAPQAAQVQQTASTSRPLDPLLVLAGLVAGVAVVCLLLVGSRAAQADGGSEAKS